MLAMASDYDRHYEGSLSSEVVNAYCFTVDWREGGGGGTLHIPESAIAHGIEECIIDHFMSLF